MFVAVMIGLASVVEILFVEGIWIFDIVTLAFLLSAGAIICIVSLSLAVAGSYLPSFLLVYVSIVKPHLSDRLVDQQFDTAVDIGAEKGADLEDE